VILGAKMQREELSRESLTKSGVSRTIESIPKLPTDSSFGVDDGDDSADINDVHPEEEDENKDSSSGTAVTASFGIKGGGVS
jgi:hypothetical protein